MLEQFEKLQQFGKLLGAFSKVMPWLFTSRIARLQSLRDSAYGEELRGAIADLIDEEIFVAAFGIRASRSDREELIAVHNRYQDAAMWYKLRRIVAADLYDFQKDGASLGDRLKESSSLLKLSRLMVFMIVTFIVIVMLMLSLCALNKISCAAFLVLLLLLLLLLPVALFLQLEVVWGKEHAKRLKQMLQPPR